MHTHERVTLSLVFGALAAVLPALVWAYIVSTSVGNPQAFHDQGHMFISLILCPLALVAALFCGIPATVLAARGTAGFGGSGSWSAWRLAATGLSAFGLLLAAGTCIGPELLAASLR